MEFNNNYLKFSNGTIIIFGFATPQDLVKVSGMSHKFSLPHEVIYDRKTCINCTADFDIGDSQSTVGQRVIAAYLYSSTEVIVNNYYQYLSSFSYFLIGRWK